MSMYSDAVQTVRKFAEARQSALDKAAAEARAAHIEAARDAATDGVHPESAAYPICLVVANTIKVGRESDGYPEVSIPEETKKLIHSAVRAGILEKKDSVVTIGKLQFHRDLSGLSSYAPGRDVDYTNWSAASEYRSRQNWSTL